MNQNKESIFPMDSFSKPKVLRIVQPENYHQEEKKRVLIDFDRTIHRYSKSWQNGDIYDPPFSGAKEAINYLKDLGYEIVIFTTRASESENGDHKTQIKNISSWLQKHDIYFDRITAEKLNADFYIDDKAIRIENGDWDSVLYTIKKVLKFRDD